MIRPCRNFAASGPEREIKRRWLSGAAPECEVIGGAAVEYEQTFRDLCTSDLVLDGRTMSLRCRGRACENCGAVASRVLDDACELKSRAVTMRAVRHGGTLF